MANRGADAFALAEIFGWSDVRMALRYTHTTDEAKLRAVEDTKRLAVEAIKLSARKSGHVLASWQKQPPVPAAVSH